MYSERVRRCGIGMAGKLTLFLFFLCLMMACTGYEQVYADEVTELFDPNFIGLGGIATADIAVGDLDNDGDLDVVTGDNMFYTNGSLQWWNAQNRIYWNDGLGDFLQEPVTDLGAEDLPTTSIALGDLDNDGDLDIVVGNTTTVEGNFLNLPQQARNRIYRNDGNGQFEEAFLFAVSDNTQSLVIADMNGDGYLDIIVGNDGEANLLYLNSGTGDFTNITPQLFGATDGATQSIAAGDVNGDGLPDLFVGNFNQPNQLYINDGNGNFVEDATFDSTSAATNGVAIAELNGQTGAEMVVGNWGEQSFIYVNDGSGTFSTTKPFGQSTYLVKDLAVADLNGDQLLDLVIGFDGLGDFVCPPGAHCARGANYLLNDGTGTFPTPSELVGSLHVATGVAVGDMNNDGLPDILQAKHIIQNTINLNTGLNLFSVKRDFGAAADGIFSIVMGDLDGVNGPDLIGIADGVNRFYLNDGTGNFPTATPLGSESDNTRAIVVGDIDADNDLDILLANRTSTVGEIKVYRNNGTAQFSLDAVLYRHNGFTEVIALGDLDGDSDLDLVSGGDDRNEIYLNDGTGTFIRSSLFGTSGEWTWGMALGDLDADGDLDIVVGNLLSGDTQNRIYLNDGYGQFEESRDLGSNTNSTGSVIVHDIDGDGDLDIFENSQSQSLIYFNDGLGNFPDLQLFADGSRSPGSIVDLNGDSLPDILGSPSSFAFNDGSIDFLQWIPIQVDVNAPIIAADVTRNGQLDLVIAELQTGYPRRIRTHVHLPAGLFVSQPGATATAQGYHTTEILDSQTIDVPYTLYDHQSTPVRAVRACYSVNGGGNWQVAVPQGRSQPAADAIVQPAKGCPYVPAWENLTATPLTTSPAGTTHTFTWDIHESGFFGRSDNVVLRLEALPDLRPTPNGIAGSYLSPLVASSTQSFRLRGTQIRVVDENGDPISSAHVYQRKQGQTGPGTAIGNGETPYRTDVQGYLQGFGAIAIGDELLALAPQPWEPTGQLAWARGLTDTIHLYHTNGIPTATGITTQIGAPSPSAAVTTMGTQVLRVSPANPLILFDLSISLEWDASREEEQTYLGQLRASLRKASEQLYDFTNGQVALGEVTVLQNAEDWGYADVVVQAANRLRPYAVQGGIVTTTTVDFAHSDIHYETGHVRMGATWSRYGNPGAELGADWALALAHELSHYFFFLDDTYLGLDDNGLLISVEDCIGSLMGDMYDPSGINTEFVPDGDWLPHCATTLAHRTLGRSEWATIAGRYPMLNVPNNYDDNVGPSWMPFDLTTIQVLNPLTPTTALSDPTFYLDYADRGFSSSNARSFLIRDEKYAFDLGSPLGGQNILKAWGAQIDDLLCAFDPQRDHFGCSPVTGTTERLQLQQDANWQPEIQVRPITSSTLEVQVRTLVATGLPETLYARIFPEFGEAGAAITLTADNNYTAVFSFTTQLDDGTEVPLPVTLGHVHVWAGAVANPTEAAMVAFRMGGNLGPAVRGGGPAVRGGGPAVRGGGPAVRGGGPAVRGGGAPVVSADGQMIFFAEDPEALAPGELYIVQSTAVLPPLPPETKMIGLGYSLLTSPNLTRVISGSVSLQYLTVDALQQGLTEGDEARLTIYYYPLVAGQAAAWQPLNSVLNTRYNLASAANQGVGFYALLDGPQQPVVTAISPTWGYNNSATTVTLTGVNLLAPLRVRLRGADGLLLGPYATEAVGNGRFVFTIPSQLTAQAYTVEAINSDQSVAITPRTFAVLAPHPGLCFTDSFAAGPGQWEVTGEWDVVPLPDGTGNGVTDSPSGSYNSAVPGTGTLSTAITSRPFDLAACPDAQLTFRHAYVIATASNHNDRGVVELWTETTQTWHPLAQFQGGGIFGLQSAGLGEEWQGLQLQPVATIDLAAYQGTVQLRFRLEVDEDVAERGWVIDDITVQPAGGAAGAPNADELTSRLFLPVIMR